MRISDVAFQQVDLGRLTTPFWNSIIKTSGRGGARVIIRTDEGITGIAPASFNSRHFVEGAMKAKIIGEDPLRTGYLWQKIYMGGTRKPVAKGDFIVAMSAVDNALWDIVGKAVEQPVWKLLGGVDPRVRAYAAGGYYAAGKGEVELCEEMARYVGLGYTAVKMKVGWSGVSLREDASRVAAVRKAIGPDIDLMVDANNAWTASTAIRFGRMIEELEPFWFEEPVRADDLAGSRDVAVALDTPVASGENEYTRWGFRDLVESRAVGVVQPDPNICGGISEWMKISAIASAHHLPVAPHGQANIGATCVAAVDNGLIAENYVTSFRDELTEPVDFADGYIDLSDRPGLGILWNEKLFA